MSNPKPASSSRTDEPAAVRRARTVGRMAQALGLAALLSAGIAKLLMYGAGVIFRYQGF